LNSHYQIERRWQTRAAILVTLSLTLLAGFLVTPGAPNIITEGGRGFGWLVCLVVFVLSDTLAGRLENGLWAGYLYLSVIVAWAGFSLPPALMLVLSGALIAAVLRLSGLSPWQMPTSSLAAAADLAFKRITTLGIPVIVAALIYDVMGGVLPLTQDNMRLVELGVALTIAFVLLQVLGHLLVDPQVPVQSLLEAGQRHRLFSEGLLIIATMPLVLVLNNNGVLPFGLLMGLIAAQAVRHRQVMLTQEELVGRMDELSLLNDVSQVVSVHLVLDDLLESIYTWACRLDLNLFYIALYDDEREELTFPLVLRGQQRIDWSKIRKSDDHLIQKMLSQPERLDLPLTEDTMSQTTLIDMAHGGTRVLGFPLKAGEKVIGVMSMIDNRDNPLQDRIDLRTLETFANQVGLAIRNATLYERAAKLASNLKQVNEAVQDIMFNIDRDWSMKTSCEVAMSITGAQKAAIFLAEDETMACRLVQSVGMDSVHRAYYEAPQFQPKSDSDQIRVVTEIQAETPTILSELATVGGFQAMAEIPLKAGSVVVGVLAVFHEEPHVYQAIELEMLETLAYQVTSALDNAELLNALELYAAEQAQLVHLSRISISSLEIDVVIADVSELLKQMLNTNWVDIGLMPKGANYIQLYRSDNDTRRAILLGDLPEIQDIATQQLRGPIIFHRSDADMSDDLREWMTLENAQTVIAMILIADNQVIGLILAGSETYRQFGESELRFVEMAGNQIAAQLHNAEMYQITQLALDRRLQQIGVIEAVAQQISSALDLETLIYNLLEATLRSTVADMAGLALAGDGDQVRIIVSQVLDDGTVRHSEWLRDMDRGLVGQVFRTGEALRVSDNTSHSEYTSFPGREFRSSLFVPLNREAQTIGVLLVESENYAHFTAEHEQFLSSLAGHAVVSIQNARLLEDRQAQIETLSDLRDLAVQLSSDTDESSVLSAIAGTALNILRAQHAAIIHDQRGMLVSLSQSDEAIQEAPLVIPETVLDDAWSTQNVLIIQDVRTDNRFISFPNSEAIDYGSLVIIPVALSEAGVYLLVTAFALKSLKRDAQNTLTLLGIQAGGHLRNAWLYQRIRSQNNRMQAILNTTRDGVILVDHAGRLVEANGSARDLLMLDFQSYLGQSLAEAILPILLPDSEVHALLNDTLTALDENPMETITTSYEITLGADKIRYVQKIESPVLDAGDQVMGRLITLRDVTEERSLAAYRDDITNMAVHDLRSPLGSIISSLFLIIETAEDSTRTEELSQIANLSLQSAQKLLSLVNSLLDIAKLEKRQMPLQRDPVDMRQIVHDAITTLATLAEDADVTVEQVIPQTLPPVLVDADKIRRVLVNLLDNAIRFTPTQETILIQAERLEDKVYVTVADSGPGVPLDERDQIFEKFRQSKRNMPSRGEKGSGLGLTYCKLAIEAHDERIWLATDGPLPGACFIFTLPVLEDYDDITDRAPMQMMQDG
jgi:two-component system, NtrC family, sensor histidine kinase KinB